MPTNLWDGTLGLGRYLLVAHQTAESRELLEQVLELRREDPAAEFVLLVPPIWHPMREEVPEDAGRARARAEDARRRFAEAGVDLLAAKVGDPSPVAAIEAELKENPGYDALVISTLPSGLSRWLKIDLLTQVKRSFPDLRVIHVAPDPNHLRR